MREYSILDHFDLSLQPDASRTVVRPFSPSYPAAPSCGERSRTDEIVARILALDQSCLSAELDRVTRALDGRHGDVDGLLLRRFRAIAAAAAIEGDLHPDRQRLIGAYFSEEYAFEAAALFNPSVVLHPEQDGLAQGEVRIVMSLRAIGEGHVSSVTFRTGVWTPGGPLLIDAASPAAMAPIIEGRSDGEGPLRIDLHCGGSRVISETVLFPITASQQQGIEDLRLVRFIEDDGSVVYHGTYTAFSGSDARSELLTGTDFRTFEMRSMSGSATAAKGMALFPRKIDGQYVMLGRQDNENLWLLYSDDLLTWEGGIKLLSPQASWEMVQIGNCGSPIEIDEGWLVLTHGVGTVRNYCMGAALLDKRDPSKVLARTSAPILEPSAQERNGYVPNVVYSCGGLVHDRMLLLPYGVADSFTSFATISVDKLLAAMS